MSVPLVVVGGKEGGRERHQEMGKWLLKAICVPILFISFIYFSYYVAEERPSMKLELQSKSEFIDMNLH